MNKDRTVLQRLWQRWDTRLCLLVIAAYCCAAGYGEAVYQLSRMADQTPSYNQIHERFRYVPPACVRLFSESPRPAGCPLYLLGSDNLGRDVAQRLVQGTRIAFHVGILTSLIAIPLGVVLGCFGGFFGGRVDSLVVWLCATVASMPGLLFILAIAMVVGQGLLGVYLGIGLTTWVSVCRNVRGEVIKHRGRTYVQAAHVLGYSRARIMFRHILPNVAHIVLIAFSIRFPASVATEVFISFLGIGVQGEPSWGIMINNARLRLWQGVWWEMTFVTLAIFALVLAFNHLADALRDLLDPALRTEEG
jgi:peptide/nickel transport system permease protein